MVNNAFITSLKKTGTHPLRLIPDPRTEKYLTSPLTEGQRLIEDGETVTPLLERIYKFALRQALVDYAGLLDMAPFKEVVEAYIETELAMTQASAKDKVQLKKKRTELVGKLIQLRKEQLKPFEDCLNMSTYINQFGLMQASIYLFRSKAAKDTSVLSPDKLRELIARNPELKTTREELFACEALQGRESIVSSFIKSRQRLLQAKLTKGKVIYRILVENFDLYIKNLIIYRQNLSNPVFEQLINQEDRASYFQIEQYPSFISQEGIDEFNGMLNGRLVSAAGINELTPSLNKDIREYNAKHAKDEHFVRLKPFSPLNKQILGDSGSRAFGEQSGFATIHDDNEYIEILQQWMSWYEDIDKLKETLGLIDRLTSLEGLYIRKNNLTGISRILFENPQAIANRLSQAGYEPQTITLNDAKVEAYPLSQVLEENILDRQLLSQYFDNMLKAILLDGEERDKWVSTLTEPFADKTWLQVPTLPTVLSTLKECIECKKSKAETAGYIERLGIIGSRFNKMLTLLVQRDEDNLLDNPIKSLIERNYSESLDNTAYVARMVRAYLTTKPTDKNKTPIYFGFRELGSGWSRASIIRSGLFIVREPTDNPEIPYYYHLCCSNLYMEKGIKIKSYLEKLDTKDSHDGWGLMYFNQLNEKLMLPAIFYNTNILQTVEGDDELRDALLNKETRKACFNPKTEEEKARLFAFLKRVLTSEVCQERYHFDEQQINACQTMDEMIQLAVEQGYTLKFQPFDHEQLEQDIEAGRILKFKIQTRRMYKPNARRSPHEQLFLAAMQGDQGVSIQGGVHIYYRPPRIPKEKTFVHKAGTILLNKYDTNGQLLVDEKGKSCYLLLLRYLNRDNDLFSYPLTHEEYAKAEALYNAKKDVLKTKVAPRDIMKNARYTEPCWTLHLPLLTNRSGLKDTDLRVKKMLDNQFYNAIQDGQYRVLSLLFSSRNLIYLTLIDANGKVIEQRSLNRLKDPHIGTETDYYSNIQTRLRQKMQIQRDLQSNVAHIESAWNKEDQIKGLKEGYISQVVSLIANYMLDGKTVLVMEDARNAIRGALFDAPILTSMQRQIIAKLACLRLRDIPLGQPGSINKPICLAKQVTSNNDLIGRNGMIYIADMCFFNKRIDHTTGFVNMLPGKELSVKDYKELINSFDDIHFDTQRQVFVMTYTPNRLKVPKKLFTLNLSEPMTFTTREADRVVFAGRTHGGTPIIETWNDITQRMAALLEESGVRYQDGGNIIPRLAKATGRSSIHKALAHLFNNLLRMEHINLFSGEEGYYSAAEDGICHKYTNAVDEAQGLVLAMRGLAYAENYLHAIRLSQEEDINLADATKVSLEYIARFIKDLAEMRK